MEVFMRYVLVLLMVVILNVSGFAQLGGRGGSIGNMLNNLTSNNRESTEPPPPNYTIEYNVNISGQECSAKVNILVLNAALEKADTAADQINDQINQMVYSNKELPSDASFGMSKDQDYTQFTVQLDGTAQSCSNVNQLIKDLESMLKTTFGSSNSGGRIKLF
jgi:hypothetical protein